MMEVYTPECDKDFEMLKRGDLILVEWGDDFIEHTDRVNKIMSYKIHEVKLKDKEIICQVKGNHYFNYSMYLEGKSVAKKVLIVADDDYISSIFFQEYRKVDEMSDEYMRTGY